MRLTLDAVRALQLAAQGLNQRPAGPATKADLLAMIVQMGALQIDTIHVVARSPYLVLWSRLGAYPADWLDQLLAEGAIFEYWSHAACFLPTADYPLYRSLTLHGQSRSWSREMVWLAENRELVDRLVQRIREHGPVRSSDFERTDGEKGGWWNWKAEKMALELLLMRGDLMIARRDRFQRIYDLRERVLPAWDDTQTPALESIRRTLVLRTIGALGVAPARWVADYYRTKQAPTLAALRALVQEGALLPVEVEGWQEPGYILPQQRSLAEQATAGDLQPTLTTLLSPFDPLVWDRRRALELFGFDYLIECYTPAPKRRYGYFTLPILWRGALVGRLDAKAHRKQCRFEVKALHLEPGVVPSEALASDLAEALHDCASWHATPEVTIGVCDPPAFKTILEQQL